MPLHREDVVSAAVELLDEVGLDRLTTRALTERLGVQRGALYWHVRSKYELLAAVAERIAAEAFEEPGEAGDGQEWAPAAAGFARRMRRALLAHRDGARVVAGYLPMNEGTLRAAESGLALLVEQGVPLERAAYFGDTVTSYVTGFVLQEQSSSAAPLKTPADPGPARGSGAEQASAAGDGPSFALDVDAYPHLTAWQSRGPVDRDAAFEAGLSTIVGGLRAELGG